RVGGQTHLTLCAFTGPGVDPAASSARLRARVAALQEARLPLADPHLTGEARISSVLPPERFEGSVTRGVERIRAGELDKVVLAREVVVEAPNAHEPAAL